MLTVGFRDLHQAAIDIRNKQGVRYPYFLEASVAVPNGGLARASLVADQDADIFIFGLNGVVIAPADDAGRRRGNDPSDFPFVLTPTGLPIDGTAERGLQMRIFDGTDKTLQLSDPVNLVDVKTLLQPGYFPGAFSRPVDFRHYLRRNGKLTFEFFNADQAVSPFETPLFHFVTLTLSCHKYEPFTK